MSAAHLKLVTAAEPAFHCMSCGKTSHGPFLPAWAVKNGFVPTPRCRNDDCATMWWNRIAPTSLFETVQHITRGKDIADFELLQLQALAKKP